MRNLESVVQKYFPNAKENKPGHYKTLCMCHDDTDASLGITIENDKIKVNCFSCNAGLTEVCAKVGAKQEEFFKYDKKEIIKQEVQQDPITIESYAKYINLPVDYLVKEFDIQNDEAYFNCKNNPSISFPYFKRNNDLIRKRHRVFLTGLDGDRFRWGKKIGGKDFTIPLYGMWKCNFTKPTVYIVEGESDLQTLYYLGLNALSLPSATVYKDSLHAGYLRGFKDIYVILDSDKDNRLDAGSDSLRKCLLKSELKDKFKFMVLDGYKDVSKLFRVVNDKKKAVEVIMENRKSDQKILEPLKKEDTKADVSPFNGEGEKWPDFISLYNQEAGNVIKGFHFPKGHVIGDMAEFLSDIFGNSYEMSLAIALSMVSGAVQRKMAVSIDNYYKENLNLWVLVSSGVSTKKTPVLEMLAKPLKKYEFLKQQEAEEFNKPIKATIKNNEQKKANLRRKLGGQKDIEIEEQIRDIDETQPELKSVPTLWMQDTSTEALISRLARNNNKMIINSAESFFDNLSGKLSGGVSNFSAYLQMYSGEAIKNHRKTNDEEVNINAPSLSQSVLLQPKELKKFVQNEEFNNRGLTARYLYLCPTESEKMPKKVLDAIAAPVEKAYEDLLFDLFELPENPDNKNQADPFLLSFTDEAQTAVDKLKYKFDKGTKKGGIYYENEAYYGKFFGQIMKLTGVLHCINNQENPYNVKIPIETFKIACELGKMFESHWKVAFGIDETNENVDKAKDIHNWIIKKKVTLFTRRVCYQSLKRKFPRVSDLVESLDVLEERGYIFRTTPDDAKKNETVNYIVNPEAIVENII